MNETTRAVPPAEQLRIRRVRADRGAVIGAVIGVVFGIAVTTGLDGGFPVLPSLTWIAAFGLLGGALGSALGAGRVQRVVDSTVGWDSATERIKNAVRTGSVPATDEERARALSWATATGLAVPLQVRFSVLIAAGLIVGAVGQFFGGTESRSNMSAVLSVAVAFAQALLTAASVPSLLRLKRQADAYLALHARPLDEQPRG